MKPVLITFKQAGDFIKAHHRHHMPSQGCKFVLGLSDENGLCAVAVIGRPVARRLDDGTVLEVTRLCVKPGVKNACSLLYSKAWRIAREMGAKRMITYILASEPGTSLKATGWIDEGEAGGLDWNIGKGHTPKSVSKKPREMKRRWSIYARGE